MATEIAFINRSTASYRHSFQGIMFGNAWYEPGGGYGPRIQQDYQFLFVHAGEAHISLEAQNFLIPAGWMAVMMPGFQETIRFSPTMRTHHTWCSAQPRIVSDSLRNLLTQAPSPQVQSSTIDLLLKTALGLQPWRNKHGQNLLHKLAFCIVDEYLRIAEMGSNRTKQESPCERARIYMEEHCEQGDCLKQAARAAGVSPAHLARLFRLEHKMTPNNYLWSLRAERGTNLLMATGLTVAEVADRCGFKDPFHFSRTMKRLQGFSPREIRRRAWQRGV